MLILGFGNFDAAPLLTTVFLLLAECGDVYVKAQKHLVERKYLVSGSVGL
jgi:hypothetical protein